MTPDLRAYRSVAELLVAVRDHHRLTQRQLAERSEIGQSQLARYESGEVEPGLPVLRRVLRSVGWLPTLGIEPTAAALDEQLTQEVVFDTDLFTLLQICIDADAAGARVVIGGEVAAALQGVPIRSTDLRYLVLEADLQTLLGAAHRRHRAVEWPDPRDDHGDAVRLVWAGVVPARVHVVSALPPACAVEWQDNRLHAVDVAVLLESGALGPAAAALAGRWLEQG